MSRSFAKLHCSMSDDPDFNRLTPDAQLVYFRLTIRPQLSRVGVTNAAPGLIASQTGIDQARVTEALHELDHARFIILDLDTGELLVRAKLRHSGYSNDKHETGALNEAQLVLSRRIIEVLVVEAGRMGWDWTHLASPPPDTQSDTQSDTEPDIEPDRALSDSLHSESLNSAENGRAAKRNGLATAKARPPDPVWDALETEFGSVTNKVDRGRRNAAAKLLRETLTCKAVPPEQHHDAVRQLCEAYRAKYRDAACTPNAVASNADLLIAHIQGRNRPAPASRDRGMDDIAALEQLRQQLAAEEAT